MKSYSSISQKDTSLSYTYIEEFMNKNYRNGTRKMHMTLTDFHRRKLKEREKETERDRERYTKNQIQIDG